MYIKIITISFFLSFIAYKIFAQSLFSYHGYIGITYGGPLPEKMSENSSGNPKIGYNFGLGINYKLSSKFEIESKINYSFKGVFYNTKYKKDTIIEQIINNNTYKFSTFYTAYVNGDMSFHYIDLFILPSLKLKMKHTIQLGPYISYLVGGFDKGNVQVVIGEGGFFGDYHEDYNNISKINQIDYGLTFGINSLLFGNFYSGFILSRSLRPLYKDDIFIRRGLEENKLYNTYVNFYIGYKFK